MRRRITQRFGAGTLGLCMVLAASDTCPAQQCLGDCDSDGRVTVDELVLNVNIALGGTSLGECSAGECLGTPLVWITCLVEMVNNALNGCSTSAQPSVTPLPTPTPQMITYQLTEGSTIRSSPAPADVGRPTFEEPLSGTFVAVAVPRALAPHAVFTLAVTRIEFQSPHFTITSEAFDGGACIGGDMAAGCIEAPLYPLPSGDVVFAGINAIINGAQAVQLAGTGLFTDPLTPILQSLQLCGPLQGDGRTCADIHTGAASGYSLTIFAEATSL